MGKTHAGAGTAVSGNQPGLRRTLSLWDLVFYGVLYVQPTGCMAIYGVVSQEARGHVVTTLLVAMFAMLLTAISYGRMARAYPSAGSAYTYVGREIHPTVGFVTGWTLALDYLLNPVITTIWCAKAAGNIVPDIPYAAWAVFFALLCTVLNLRGIRATARTNQFLVSAMCVVVVFFLVAAARYVLQLPAVSFTRPFYDPVTFSLAAVSTGTSIAVISYIGFDGIATLSEEAHNPRRDILLATVLTCLLTGLFAASEAYAAQLVWPEFKTYPDVDTAIVHIAGRAGGATLFALVNLTLLVANLGSGLGAQLAGARLLYAMGRDRTLPIGFFGLIEPNRRIPQNNVLFTGVVVLVGSFLISFQFGAELLNFGAFVGFMGVNAAAFSRSFLLERERNVTSLLPPILGFVVCLYIWVSLRTPAKIAGGVWLAIGILYTAYKTRGFRQPMVISEPPRV